MTEPTSRELVHRAWKLGLALPSFNVPHLPMMEPIIKALRDTGTMGQVAVARVEWKRFAAGGPTPIFEEYQRFKDERFVRLHLDHIPVVDEDQQRVDYVPLFTEALGLGYDSVMVDGSRLPLEENIAATHQVVEMAQETGAAVEAELGAVLGHEAGPLPPYEELYESGRGFTDPGEARRFVQETGVDWLSVAVGNIHGAVSEAARSEKKVEARLNLEHLAKLREAAGVPLVLHGGSGIKQEFVRAGFREGIAKINVGTNVRQAYEAALVKSVEAGRQAVYDEVVRLLVEEYQLAGSAERLREG
ncbi:class II fructose-bisphosphate aldolase [bacterium]|nr:class II fructose-bisphosphate aldolase [bacterium]